VSIDPIKQYLSEAGITSSNPNYGLQYNLCHASLSPFGIRAGLELQVATVLRSRGLGAMTDEGREEFLRRLQGIKDRFCSAV
jgi:hypothetical protein